MAGGPVPPLFLCSRPLPDGASGIAEAGHAGPLNVQASGEILSSAIFDITLESSAKAGGCSTLQQLKKTSIIRNSVLSEYPKGGVLSFTAVWMKCTTRGG